jgi:hypothetical protein
MDVVYALKRQGRTIYGFGGWISWLIRNWYVGLLLFFSQILNTFIKNLFNLT